MLIRCLELFNSLSNSINPCNTERVLMDELCCLFKASLKHGSPSLMTQLLQNICTWNTDFIVLFIIILGAVKSIDQDERECRTKKTV